jgi:hypothetical protein
MIEWLSNAPELVSYLIGMLAIMAGAILLLGALLLRESSDNSGIPSMRPSMKTIPPRYSAIGSKAEKEQPTKELYWEEEEELLRRDGGEKSR